MQPWPYKTLYMLMCSTWTSTHQIPRHIIHSINRTFISSMKSASKDKTRTINKWVIRTKKKWIATIWSFLVPDDSEEAYVSIMIFQNQQQPSLFCVFQSFQGLEVQSYPHISFLRPVITTEQYVTKNIKEPRRTQ